MLPSSFFTFKKKRIGNYNDRNGIGLFSSVGFSSEKSDIIRNVNSSKKTSKNNVATLQQQQKNLHPFNFVAKVSLSISFFSRITLLFSQYIELMNFD